MKRARTCTASGSEPKVIRIATCSACGLLIRDYEWARDGWIQSEFMDAEGRCWNCSSPSSQAQGKARTRARAPQD